MRIRLMGFLLALQAICMGHTSGFSQSGMGAASPFQKAQVLAPARKQGLTGFPWKSDLVLPGLPAGDSLHTLAVTAWLETAEGQPVMASHDAQGLMDHRGVFRDSIPLSAPRTQARMDGVIGFIPFYALSLPPGRHQLNLRLKLQRRGTSVILGESAPLPIQLDMPQRNLYRLKLEALEVFDTDFGGETWDYVLLSPREVYPELQWSLSRGSLEVFRSERARNTLHYPIDSTTSRTHWINLAQGDSLGLKVEDFDLLSFSDLIGTTMISPGSLKGGDMPGAFRRVRTCRLGVEEMKLPLYEQKVLAVKPGQRHQGVSGTTVHLRYEVSNYPGDGLMRLELETAASGAALLARHAHMIEGPALFHHDGYLELHAPRGELRFFMPWYGMSHGAGILRMTPEVLFPDGNQYTIGREALQWNPTDDGTQDFEFGQQSIEPDTLMGLGGFRVSTAYRLSSAYRRDLPKAQVRLVCSFLGPPGHLPNEWMQHRLGKGAWSRLDGPVIIPSNRDTGTIDVFIPYWVLSDSGRQLVRVGHSALLTQADGEAIIGSSAHELELRIPALRTHLFHVKRVSLKRSLKPEPGAGTWWRIKVGSVVVYESMVEKGYLPNWPPDAEAKIISCPGDRFTLEVIQRNRLGKDARLAQWTGAIEDLPLSSGKSGTLRLLPELRLDFKVEAKD